MIMVERARAIVVDPHAEWPAVAQESGDAAFLTARYIAPLALIPAIAGLIGEAVVGVTAPDGATLRAPILGSLLTAVFGYVANIVVVFVVAAMVEMLAPRFGAKRSFGNALKLAVYSFTPVWLAGIFLLIPGLRFLELLGGYGVYLLWAGLPPLMKTPKHHAPAYAAIVAACAIALLLLARTAQDTLFAVPGGI